MWKDLSMQQRADLMDIYLSYGVTSLDEMRRHYDSRDIGTANAYGEGGDIHIKPENRGKFTALKERTGHSATWFKEHGTPAQKKMAIFALNSRHWKHGLGGELNNYNYGNTFGDGGLFGNKTIDTVASFLPVLGTAEDAYQFYKDPSWANAGWLALSLGSDIFTGGMASRAIKAARAANKAVDAAKAANKAAAQEFRAARRANGANHTRQSGTKVRHAIKAAGSATDNRNAAIMRANDALFDTGIKVGVDQGTNAFLNAIQLDMLPDIRELALGGNIYDGTTESRY